MNFKEYNLKRKIINQCYCDLDGISQEFKYENLLPLIKESLKFLKDDNFKMVVVGEFSRGKSTFINALLGERLLPAFTKPTTTIINKISYGEIEEYKLNFRNNKKAKEITRNEFKKIIAIREPNYDDEVEVKKYDEDVKMVSNIAYSDIKYPIQICKDGIEIIDTPGTNDLDQVREEITFNFIPQSDVAVFLLSANQILSQSEIYFLKERILENDIKKVFFIINFKDRLATIEDEKKVMKYAKEHLKEIIVNPKIFMVSAKQAMNFKRKKNGEEIKGIVPETFEETGFDEMEKEIFEYLVNEKGSIKLKKYIDRGVRLSEELINKVVNVKLSTVNLSVCELQKKLAETKPYFKKTKEECENIISQLRNTLISLENEYVKKYRGGLESIADRACLAVNSYDGELDSNTIFRNIENTIAPLQNDLQGDMRKYKERFIDAEIQKYVNKIQRIWSDLEVDFSKSLVVQNEKTREDLITFNDITTSNFNTSNDSNLFTSVIAGGIVVATFHLPVIIIPAAIIGRKYFNDYMNNVNEQKKLVKIKNQIDMRYREIIPSQVDAFRKEYIKNMESIIIPLEEQVFSKIQDMEKQLQNLINEKKAEDLNIERETQRLNNYKIKIKTIQKELKECYSFER